MKQRGFYQYKVYFDEGVCADGSTWKGWVYEIYDLDSNPELVRESDEWFDGEFQAECAAIGHICLLEDGEG